MPTTYELSTTFADTSLEMDGAGLKFRVSLALQNLLNAHGARHAPGGADPIPTGTTSTTLCIGNDARLPSAAEKSALAGTTGTPGAANKFVTDTDTRLTNARAPTAHNTTHQNGGADELDVTGLSGLLADAQNPVAHATQHKHGGGDEVAVATAAANAIPKADGTGKLAFGWMPTGSTSTTLCVGNDTRLSDDRIASSIRTGSSVVSVGTAAAPAPGQILTATGPASASWLSPALDPAVNGFRLSTSATSSISISGSFPTLYLQPHTSNAIALSLGSAGTWYVYRSGAVSLALSGLTAGTPADIFAYASGGAVALELVNWTNPTTRAVALAQQDGVWIKQSDMTRRYVGTILPSNPALIAHQPVGNGSTAAVAALWNQDNRLPLALSYNPGSGFVVYSPGSVNTLTPWGGLANAKLTFVTGLAQDSVDIRCLAGVAVGSNASNGVAVGFTVSDSAFTSSYAWQYFNGPQRTTVGHASAAAVPTAGAVTVTTAVIIETAATGGVVGSVTSMGQTFQSVCRVHYRY